MRAPGARSCARVAHHIHRYLLLLLLLLLPPSLAAPRRLQKICDVVEFRVKTAKFGNWTKKRLCAPAAFIPGFGKCGTNALKQYLLRHPLIKFPIQSETNFGLPHPGAGTLVDRVDFVKRHNPGVTPDDPYIWVAKSPSVFGDVPEHDYYGLARRLRETYPSARMILTLCDPEQLPFRWFRHFMLRTVMRRLGSSDATVHEMPEDPHRNALGELNHFVQTRLHMTNLLDLYPLLNPIDTGCTLLAEQREAIAQIGLRFKMNHWNLSNAWSVECTCRQKEQQANMPPRVLGNFSLAGYELHRSMEIVVMEEWASRGEAMMSRLLSLLGLGASARSARESPWVPRRRAPPPRSAARGGP